MVLNRERSYFFDSCSHNLYSFENVRKAHQWDILSPSVGTVCWVLGMETQIDLTIVQPWTFLGHSSGQQEHWSVTFRLGIVLTPGFFTCEWTEGRGRIQSYLVSWKRGAKSWRFPIPARLLCPWAAPQGVPAGGNIPLPARGWLSSGPTLSRHLRVSPSAPIPVSKTEPTQTDPAVTDTRPAVTPQWPRPCFYNSVHLPGTEGNSSERSRWPKQLFGCLTTLEIECFQLKCYRAKT